MKKDTIRTLALGDLDIAELEQRIELATAATAAWGCDDCAVNCDAVCTQFYICQANVFK